MNTIKDFTMTREIKFRAYNKTKGIMEVVHNLCPTYNSLTIVGGSDFDDEYDVLQYAGVVDKNRVEIYEGDIVSLSGINHSVVFHNGAFVLFYRNAPHVYNPKFGLLEVVGNIYENEELLGGNNESSS